MKLYIYIYIVFFTFNVTTKSESYSKKIINLNFKNWICDNPNDLNGVYKSVDFDDTLEEYYYLKAYVKGDNNDDVMFSIIKIHIPPH
jgi:hypothetical protein